MEPQIQFCRSPDGTRLALATAGQSSDHPLLLVPSLASDIESLQWEEFFGELASRRYLVTFDRRGSGASERDIEQLSLETELTDIETIADCLMLSTFDLWGTQEAAGIAAAFAAMNPKRVSRLILWDGFASGPQIARPGAVEGFNSLVTSNWRLRAGPSPTCSCQPHPRNRRRGWSSRLSNQ